MRKESVRDRYGVIALFLLFLILSVSGCGGGGGEASDSGGGLTTSEYDFALDLDLTGTNVTPFQLATTAGEITNVHIPFAGIPGNPVGTDFNGTLKLSQQDNELAISSITVDDTTVFTVDVSDIWENTGLKITVVEPIVFEGGDDPSDGGFTMENGTDDPVTVSFSKTGDIFMATISGVASPVELDDLKGYLDTSSNTLEQQLSVAYHMIEMLYDQVTFVAGAIVKIEDDDLGTIQGDPHAGLPDTTGGTLTLSCTSGSIVPGADFSVVFDNFWQDDPDDDIDTLIDGSVELRGFLRNETNDVLQNIGFAWSDGAGVFFDDDGVAFYETQDTGGGLTVEWTHTVLGSYAIVFIPQ